jgi:2-keto-4-pentenoate hydratase
MAYAVWYVIEVGASGHPAGVQSDIEALAAELDAAYSGPPIAPVRDRLGDVDSAYAVQAAQVASWCAGGRRAVGRKIGLTNPAVQAQLGVDQPDYGTLMEDRRIPDGGVLDLDRALQPRLEAEITLMLRRDLPLPDVTAEDVAAATAFAVASLEVIDSRIAGWDIDIRDTIADNASSGWFVLGTRSCNIEGVDLSACRMSLRRNGSEVSSGSGQDCLGNPLSAAAWLASEMARRGSPLAAGDIVLTGALGPVVEIEEGDVFEATISELGDVSLRAGRGGGGG